jgi:hypothetical protein
MTISSSRFAVELRVTGIPNGAQRVVVSGSIPELGMWADEKSVEMQIRSQNGEAYVMISFSAFVEFFKLRFSALDHRGAVLRDMRKAFSFPDQLLGDISVSSAIAIVVKLETKWGEPSSHLSLFVPERPLGLPNNAHALKQVAAQLAELRRLKDQLRADVIALKSLVMNHNEQVPQSHEPYGTMIRDLLYEINELKGKVKVVARIRPLIAEESKQFSFNLTNYPSAVTVHQPGALSARSFNFDDVFDQSVDNKTFYDSSKVKNLIESSVLIANNVCVFSYGQTNSGKTHTVLGTRGEPGIVELGLRSVFDVMAAHSESKIVEIEMVEIYRENVFVLIDRCEVYDFDQTISLLHARIQERATAATGMNSTSSRSHCIMSISITDEDTDQSSNIYIVDLAGSERIKVSGASGDRLAEANAINKSLSALGLVLNSLLHKRPFVPYRDSKLTKLLAPVFTVADPPSKVVMIANLSPSIEDERESLSTLQFAQRVSDIELRDNTDASYEIQEKEEELNRVIQKQRSEIDLLRQRFSSPS